MNLSSRFPLFRKATALRCASFTKNIRAGLLPLSKRGLTGTPPLKTNRRGIAAFFRMRMPVFLKALKRAIIIIPQAHIFKRTPVLLRRTSLPLPTIWIRAISSMNTEFFSLRTFPMTKALTRRPLNLFCAEPSCITQKFPITTPRASL